MQPKSIHAEFTFEASIEASLLNHCGYIQGDPESIDRQLAIDPGILFSFLQSTQPKKWEKLSTIHGASVEQKLIQRLFKELEIRGALDVIRHGFTDYGVSFKLAYFKPESSLNPETEKLYALNHLVIYRQVHYDSANENSLDMVIGLNGIPVVTLELKNPLTGQNTEHAVKQYMYDRNPKTQLLRFNKRALVHFAVDPNTVQMTTKLKGKDTRFFPFDLGHENGAGNPPNPDGYRTAYLWQYILAKDSLLDIIGRYLHLEIEEVKMGDKRAQKETLIFPRFHQLDLVRKTIADCRKGGLGKSYLVQHSAGSGKSNSIAWLSYRLASLHNDQDEKVFDSVIVVTDRVVLDRQLQNTIYQFEHKEGVVQKIEKHSGQLAEALEKGNSIIITTLQKFPFVLDKIGKLPKRKYAVIIDEVHSSQGGEASKKMKEVLSAADLEEASTQNGSDDDFDAEDEIRESMMARGKQENLSFFGFTATPKAKTLEVFGEKGTDGKPRPFHLYSMKQAIQEGFIMDVLLHYTTYKTYFRLTKAIEGDPKVNKVKATKAIGKYLSLHPHNLAQKTEVIIEHFRQIVMKKIGGMAKAMVVTGSRLHAVRYYFEFKRYIQDKGYHNIKPLVAFSGTVYDPDVSGSEYTEASLNGFSEKQLAREFNKPEYQILLVAEKYQTGFDQPLLHTMYVDKKLSGVKAVQTLSRLNRIHPGKEDTFVLDFANDEEDILHSFQPYYELTTIEEPSDPNHLYDLKIQIEKHQVIWQSEMDAFCKLYFSSKERIKSTDQGKLYAYINPAVDRYKALQPEEAKEEFKHALVSFARFYSFLSQIMPFQDVALEKLYTYGRFLLKTLPKDTTDPFRLHDEVALEYYRLQKIKDDHQIVMESQDEDYIKGVTDAGMGSKDEEKSPISEIIELLNQRFGTEFSEANRLFIDQVKEDMIANEDLSFQAKNNTLENFSFGFREVFESTLIDRMDMNQDIFKLIMDDKEFGGKVKTYLLKEVYKQLRERV
ncbi:MAG: type I restriction endonuclease [Bacteroidota bacterium]